MCRLLSSNFNPKLNSMARPIKIDELPAVCITLARRPDRWARFAAQPELENLPKLEKFNAVDGRTIDVVNDFRINTFTKKNIIEKKRRSHWELDSIGGVGCALSHIACWKKAIDSNSPYFLIMEDDAVVPNGFVDLMNAAFKAHPEYNKFDLMILTRVFKPKTLEIPEPLFTEAESFVLSHCYIVSRRAAQLFYADALPISGHIDLYMSVLSKVKGLRVLCSRELALQQAGSPSDIQTKPVCRICDVPVDFENDFAMIPHFDWRLAKTSEWVLIAGVVSYVLYTAWWRSKE